MQFRQDNPSRRLIVWVFAAAVMYASAFALQRSNVFAQADPVGPTATAPDTAGAGADPAPPPAAKKSAFTGLAFFKLLVMGGSIMIPIGGMSLLVVAISIERFLSLRRSKMMPEGLILELGQLGSGQSSFDPRKAYRLCQQYPSATATVIRAMLLKVGRPHSEVEHAVSEASDREAGRLYANVRWLNLATAVTPLMGLLGTVWGMIQTFHETTILEPGQNKADHLAAGIYVALVTTLGGLMVAIPSAMLAHYFEGRIIALFHQIDELLFNLMPMVERYEGRVRFSQKMSEDGGEAAAPPPAPTPQKQPAAAVN